VGLRHLFVELGAAVAYLGGAIVRCSITDHQRDVAGLNRYMEEIS
jgi:hypothetical protein